MYNTLKQQEERQPKSSEWREKLFEMIDLIDAIAFGPKIIQIGALLAIFRPFENFGNRPDGNLNAAVLTICWFALGLVLTICWYNF